MAETIVQIVERGWIKIKNDLINRQAAIDALSTPHSIKRDCVDLSENVSATFYDQEHEEWTQKAVTIADVLDSVCDEYTILPYVQPIEDAVPVIRCKDCKWYGRADKRRFYRGMDCLQKRIDTIVPDKDYCSRAERKEE